MRKMVLIFILCCSFSVLSYAKGNLELYAGLPLAWDESEAMGYSVSTQTTSFSLGFGFVSPINERISFGVHDEIIFPQKIEGSINGKKSTLTKDDYDSIMGMSVLLGPVFYLFSSTDNIIRVPLNVGFRWMWMSMSTEYASTFGSQFGLGAGIGIEFHPSEKIYIFGRFTGIYDFYTLGSTTTATTTINNSGIISSFWLTPQVGVGISF